MKIPIFKEFKTIYVYMNIFENLNEEQIEIVKAIEGPILVVAGAGTGKTTTLTRRVAYLLEQKIDPSQILLLTFTRSASKSMIERARNLNPKANDVYGGTFHSVAANLIREAPQVFGLKENFTVLDPDDARDSIKQCMNSMPKTKINVRASEALKVISWSSNTQQDIPDSCAKIDESLIEISDWMSELKDKYIDYKLKKDLVDYDDLLLLFASCVEHEQIGPSLRKRWPFIMVDEHQDSNPVQLRIIYGLGGNTPNVMAVGDPSQAIYGFRGSAPQTMMDFKKHWPETRVLKLQVNYRSNQPILDLVNAVDESQINRFERKLISFESTDTHLPKIIKVGTSTEQSQKICDKIEEMEESGIEFSKQAIIVRSMFAARSIEPELLARRIPYKVLGGIRIDEAAHVKDFLSFCRVSDNTEHTVAWIRLLSLLEGVGPKKAEALIPFLQKDQWEKAPWPKDLKYEPIKLALSTLSGVGSLPSKLLSAIETVNHIMKNKYQDEWKDRKKDIETLADIASNHPSMTEFLSAITIDYSFDKQKVEDGDKPSRPLTISTVHSAKGLEWDVVYMPQFIQGHMPSAYATETEEKEEELRVFYVATSRAKKHLFFYKPAYSIKGLSEDSDYENIIEDFVEKESSVTNPSYNRSWSSFGSIDRKKAMKSKW